MLTLSTIFFSSFVIALSGALMPGPLLSVTISESGRRGLRAGPLLIMGHSLLELALLAALFLGLAPVLQLDSVFIAVALAGSIFLGWNGVGMLKELPALQLVGAPETDTSAVQRNLILAGILLSLSNPYWIIWWATIGLSALLQCRQNGLSGIVSFFSGHILADLLWYSLVGLVISQGKRYFTDLHYRGLIGACAIFLLFFAAYFAYAGISRGLGA